MARPKRIDWSDVDWTRTNAEIALSLGGIRRETVSRARVKHGQPKVCPRFLPRIEDVITTLLASGFDTAIHLPAILTGERKPTPGMLRALVKLLGGGEDDEIAAMRACGWTTKDARAFLRELAKVVTDG